MNLKFIKNIFLDHPIKKKNSILMTNRGERYGKNPY